jgi:hypothetical protein
LLSKQPKRTINSICEETHMKRNTFYETKKRCQRKIILFTKRMAEAKERQIFKSRH